MGDRRHVRLLGIAACAAMLAGCASIVTLEPPTLADAEPHPSSLASRVVAADGTELAELRREHREPVSLSQVPGHLLDAVLIAEDRRFFDHGGVDARATLRATLANRRAGHVQQGGSTITQQLIKLRYLPDLDRSYGTKLREAMLARELEADRSKAAILEEYLNAVYLGEGAYGVQAAAETYFRRDVSELEVHQSALLAAIIRAPSTLAPTHAPAQAQARRDDVLRRMRADGHLTEREHDLAVAAPVEVVGRAAPTQVLEPHLVDRVVRTLLADLRLGETETERADRLYRGGLTIHTTLDLELQASARQVLSRHLPDPDDPEAAVTVIEPDTGRVLAAVGNRAHDQLQYDLPTQARRQPGSTFKTFVLARAIADGRHPDDLLDGRPGTVATPVGSWRVRNYDRDDPGQVSLSGATRVSVNAAFARLGVELGSDRVAALARDMGVTSAVPADDPQIALGGGQVAVTTTDLAAGYATLANGGRHVPTTVIDRVVADDGRVVWEADREPRRVLDADVAYVTTQVLQGVVEAGTGLDARVEGWQVAGKTGTTSDHVDAWFAGTTPTVAAAVWVGHAEGRVPLHDVQGVPRVTGGTIPARIFSEVVAAAVDGRTPVPFELDDARWVTVEVDPRTGLRAAAWCPGERVRVPRVLAPSETCPAPPPAPPPAAEAPTSPPATTPPTPTEPLTGGDLDRPSGPDLTADLAPEGEPDPEPGHEAARPSDADGAAVVDVDDGDGTDDAPG